MKHKKTKKYIYTNSPFWYRNGGRSEIEPVNVTNLPVRCLKSGCDVKEANKYIPRRRWGSTMRKKRISSCSSIMLSSSTGAEGCAINYAIKQYVYFHADTSRAHTEHDVQVRKPSPSSYPWQPAPHVLTRCPSVIVPSAILIGEGYGGGGYWRFPYHSC